MPFPAQHSKPTPRSRPLATPNSRVSTLSSSSSGGVTNSYLVNPLIRNDKKMMNLRVPMTISPSSSTSVSSSPTGLNAPGKDSTKKKPGMVVPKKEGKSLDSEWHDDGMRGDSSATAVKHIKHNNASLIHESERGKVVSNDNDEDGDESREERKCVVGLAELIQAGKGTNRAPREPLAKSLGFSLLVDPTSNVLAVPDDDPSHQTTINLSANSLPTNPSLNILSKHSSPGGIEAKAPIVMPGTYLEALRGEVPELSTSFGTPNSREEVPEPLEGEGDEEWDMMDEFQNNEEKENNKWIGVEDDKDSEMLFFDVDMVEEDSMRGGGGGKGGGLHDKVVGNKERNKSKGGKGDTNGSGLSYARALKA